MQEREGSRTGSPFQRMETVPNVPSFQKNHYPITMRKGSRDRRAISGRRRRFAGGLPPNTVPFLNAYAFFQDVVVEEPDVEPRDLP